MPDAPIATVEARTYRIGDAEIVAIAEIPRVDFEARRLLPDWDPALLGGDADWMVPTCLDAGRQRVTLAFRSWLLKIDGRNILIDAGAGNGKARASEAFDGLDTPFLERLAAAGVAPDEIDHVLVTHLHVDHVGWLTTQVDGRWVPTFPNAKVFLPRTEKDRKAALLERLGPSSPETGFYADSVVPILDRTALVGAAGGEVLPGLSFHPTPGHSIGHMSIELESRGAVGLFAGDVMHHPSQVGVPAWSSMYCSDPRLGRASRLWVLERAAARRATVFSSHFPEPSVGTIERVGQGFRWRCA